jgi:hypothetical protein
MIDDPDIFRAARLLIDQHGEDAPIRAAQRADALADEGDMEDGTVWRRILEAIAVIRRPRSFADRAASRSGGGWRGRLSVQWGQGKASAKASTTRAGAP